MNEAEFHSLVRELIEMPPGPEREKRLYEIAERKGFVEGLQKALGKMGLRL